MAREVRNTRLSSARRWDAGCRGPASKLQMAGDLGWAKDRRARKARPVSTPAGDVQAPAQGAPSVRRPPPCHRAGPAGISRRAGLGRVPHLPALRALLVPASGLNPGQRQLLQSQIASSGTLPPRATSPLDGTDRQPRRSRQHDPPIHRPTKIKMLMISGCWKLSTGQTLPDAALAALLHSL
jgi:hypothetical protein